MFKKERKTCLILLIEIMIPLTIIVIIPFLLYCYGHFTITVKKVYETNWGISLPDGMKLLNDKNTESFHGDGYRFTVYSISKEKKYFTGYKTSKNKEIEETCKTIISSLRVESKYIPHFNENYVWTKYKKYNDNLIIIYFPNQKRLYLFQQNI